jgi:hypothetical protein
MGVTSDMAHPRCRTYGLLATLGADTLVFLGLEFLGFLNVPPDRANERRQGLHVEFVEAGLGPIDSTAGANVDDVGDRLRDAKVDRDLKGLTFASKMPARLSVQIPYNACLSDVTR